MSRGGVDSCLEDAGRDGLSSTHCIKDINSQNLSIELISRDRKSEFAGPKMELSHWLRQ